MPYLPPEYLHRCLKWFISLIHCWFCHMLGIVIWCMEVEYLHFSLYYLSNVSDFFTFPHIMVFLQFSFIASKSLSIIFQNLKHCCLSSLHPTRLIHIRIKSFIILHSVSVLSCSFISLVMASFKQFINCSFKWLLFSFLLHSATLFVTYPSILQLSLLFFCSICNCCKCYQADLST